MSPRARGRRRPRPATRARAPPPRVLAPHGGSRPRAPRAPRAPAPPTRSGRATGRPARPARRLGLHRRFGLGGLLERDRRGLDRRRICRHRLDVGLRPRRVGGLGRRRRLRRDGLDGLGRRARFGRGLRLGAGTSTGAAGHRGGPSRARRPRVHAVDDARCGGLARPAHERSRLRERRGRGGGHLIRRRVGRFVGFRGLRPSLGRLRLRRLGLDVLERLDLVGPDQRLGGSLRQLGGPPVGLRGLPGRLRRLGVGFLRRLGRGLLGSPGPLRGVLLRSLLGLGRLLRGLRLALRRLRRALRRLAGRLGCGVVGRGRVGCAPRFVHHGRSSMPAEPPRVACPSSLPQPGRARWSRGVRHAAGDGATGGC